MRNINLLPKKPLINKIYLPILITMICFFVATAITLSFYSFATHSNNATEQNEVDKLQARITELNALHQVDPLTGDYEGFVAQVKQLKSERRDWVPFFDTITQNLFESSRLIKMAVNNEDLVSLNMEFTSLKDIAEYSTLLQRSELIAEVGMGSIKEIYKSETPLPSVDIVPVITPTAPVSNIPTADQLLEMFGPKASEPTSESNQLLNELNAIINKQSIKQQFGIDLPIDSTSGSPIDPILGVTPFSEQEIKAAQRALDDFKQKQILSDPVIETPEIPTIIPETSLVLNQYYVYEVILSIKLKALPQGK